ncbi:MAG: hypothetical protein V4724_21535 [Pseudomonadota bacterium]
MDQQKLRSLVFDKTGVKIDIDDPVFALVALNEAVLEEAVERHIARIDAASQELARHARAAGGLPVSAPVHDAAGMPVHDTAAAPASGPPGAAPPSSVTPREWRLLGAAAGIAVLSALLAGGVHSLFSKPAPAPAAALTPAQSAAIAQGEKLARAIEKLDPKIRQQIQAELQK